MNEMTPNEARRILVEMGATASYRQVKMVSVLDEAFVVFLQDAPDEEEFCRCMKGIILTPKMLYHVWGGSGG